MRIAYLASAAIPSASANSLQVLKMCEAMMEDGHAVTLLAPSVVGLQGAEQVREHYGLRCVPDLLRIELPRVMGRRGLAWHMARTAQRLRPDLIYTRGVDMALAAAWFRRPVVLELHQLPSGRLGPLYLRLVLRHGACRRLVVISQRLRELLLAAYPDARAIETVVAGDAYDDATYRLLPESHEARRRLGLKVRGVLAGYFGSVVPGRGVELILAIAEALAEIQFLIAGGAEDPAKTVPANVHWVGRIPPAHVPLHQAACDVLLMPYQTRVTVQGVGDTAEIMSPLKLYEYMAAGRLILSSDLPALRTMLDESNAVLLPAEDPRAWIEALRQMRRATVGRRRLAHQAQLDVAPHTWRNRVRTVLADLGATAR